MYTTALHIGCVKTPCVSGRSVQSVLSGDVVDGRGMGNCSVAGIPTWLNSETALT